MVVYRCAFPDFEAWTVVIQDGVLDCCDCTWKYSGVMGHQLGNLTTKWLRKKIILRAVLQVFY